MTGSEYKPCLISLKGCKGVVKGTLKEQDITKHSQVERKNNELSN